MVRSVVALFIAFGILVIGDVSLFSNSSIADESKQVTDKAQKSRGSGANENIKSKSDKNDPNADIPAPANKSGDKSRAGVCCITVDNYTAWKVQLYVDGNYQGLLWPWGDGTSCVYSGATRIYAMAEFTDGTYSDWGPRVFNCRPGKDYTWNLDS